MYKFIRKTIPLGVAILLLAAGLFLVDVNNQAVASSAPADTCSTSGAAASNLLRRGDVAACCHPRG